MLLVLGLVFSLLLGGGADAQTTWTRVRLCEHHHFVGQCHTLEPMSAACKTVPAPVYRKVSSFKVTTGCCKFYLTDDCKLQIFAAENREDATLDGRHNDQIAAYRCWFDCSF